MRVYELSKSRNFRDLNLPVSGLHLRLTTANSSAIVRPMTSPPPVPGFVIDDAAKPPTDNPVVDEITRLKLEIERLQKALEQNTTTVNDVTNVPSLLKDHEFVSDFARFSEGILDEKFLRRKYRFSDDVWTRLGENDALIERIELEKVARQRSGATKRELAQKFIIRGPGVLNSLMLDERTNPKNKVDAIRTLDALAANGPQAATQEDRIHIVINLGANERVVVDAPINPVPPNNTIPNIIDATPPQEQLPPQKMTDNSDGE